MKAHTFKNPFNTLALCSVLSSIALSGISGCTLEHAIERGDRCPPRTGGDMPEDGISFIVLEKNKICDESNAGCFPESFAQKICPIEADTCYESTEHKYYCMKHCEEGRVACNGNCIDPKTDTAYCGARGLCTSDDPDSQQYSGAKCNEGQSCDNGTCRQVTCNEGEHKKGMTCEPDSKEACGSVENNCTLLPHVKEVECENAQCVIQKCESGYFHVDGECIASPCATKENRCSEDGLLRYYCDASNNPQIEKCEEGKECHSGVCISNVGTKCTTEEDCGEEEICREGSCISNPDLADPTLGEHCEQINYDARCGALGLSVLSCAFDETKDDFVVTSKPCGDYTSCVDGKCVCESSMKPRCIDPETVEKCVDGNLTTERCETGKACNGGICNIPGETCTASSDCPSNEETVYVCVRGQCLIQPNCYPGITAPRCENASTLKKCDENGVLRTTTCQYYETCESTIKSGDTCVSREGKACNEDSFTNQCFLAEDNNQYLEKCINNKIAFKNCTTAGSSSSMYCASIHGITECMFSCPSTHVESANCTADPYGAYFSMCTKGEDVAGNAGFFSVPYKGYCEKTLAQYCYKDALKNITMMALDCNSLNPATTCDASLDPSKGFCQGLASCSTPTASCDGKTAINCIPNPVGEGNVLITSDCASECDVYSPSSDSSWKMAKCYLEKAGKGSTFGLCLGDGTIGVLEGDHSLILTCMANTVKLTSENGHEYCICAE